MSRYTQTIKSILMSNMRQGESITDLDDIYAIGLRSIFDVAPMNVISADYRQRLITAFCLHYFDDEYGVETLLRFKLGIAEKIITNAEYINGIFADLDNQLLANYSTRLVSGTGREVVTDVGTIANTGTVENAKSGDDTTKRTGSSTDSHTGTNGTIEHTDDILSKSGSETTRNEYEDESTKNGSIIRTKEGSEINAHDTIDTTHNFGTVTVSGGEVVTETTHNEDSTKNNSGSYDLDTPMNEVENLRSSKTTPGAAYDATGKGISALVDSSMKYMTNASLQDATNVGESDQTVERDASDSETRTTDNSGNTVERDGNDTLSFNNRRDVESYNNYIEHKEGENESTLSFAQRIDDRDVSHSKTDTFNESTTKTDNLQDKTEYNSEETRTDNLLTSKDNTLTKDSESGNEEISKLHSMELILRSEPYMNKIWTEVFDELFMGVY